MIDPISLNTIKILTSLAFNYANEQYKKHQSTIEKAYERALEEWCKNDSIRNSSSVQRYASIEKLKDHLCHPENLPEDLKSLLCFWLKGLRAQPLTYLYITEQQNFNLQKTCDRIQVKLEKLCPSTFIEEYSIILDYIPRTVRNRQTVESWVTNILQEAEYKGRSLYYYFTQEDDRQYILYSEAQSGKSTEIKHLAATLQASELYNVSLFSLKLYQQGTLINQVDKNNIFDTNTDKYQAFLLDGLDEIRDDERYKAIKEIEALAGKYPNSYILVSCRGNYQPTNKIEGFKDLYLNLLSYYDVRKYIQEKCSMPQRMLAQIEQMEIYQLCYLPFFLKTLTGYHNENKSLPSTKGEIYRYVIGKSFQIDNKRPVGMGGALTLSEQGRDILRRIAFVMQTSELQSLDVNNCKQMKLAEHDLLLCLNFSIFKRDVNGFCFEHNTFKEFLVAEFLCNQNLEIIKSIVCFDSTQKIKPSWYNVLILYLDLLTDNQERFSKVIQWLISTEPKIVIMSDSQALAISTRRDLFIATFLDLKRLKLDISWEEREEKALSNLYSGHESILYLYEELKQQNQFDNNLRNIMRLLRYSNWNELNKSEFDKIKIDLLAVVNKYSEIQDAGYYVCLPFRHPRFQTIEFVTELFSSVENTMNVDILNYFFDLLSSLKISDQYAKWIIRRYHDIHDYTTERGHTVIASKEHIINAISAFDNTENIVEALSMLAEEKYYSDLRIDNHNKNSQKILAKLRSVIDVNFDTLRLYDIICKEFKREKYKLLIPYKDFYIATNTDQQLYELARKKYISAFNSVERTRYENITNSIAILSFTLTAERAQNILNDDSLSSDAKITLLNWLGESPFVKDNLEVMKLINKEISSQNNWKEQLRKRTQDGFNILFDYTAFSELVFGIINQNEEIDTSYSRQSNSIEEQTNESIWSFISDFEYENTELVDKEQVKTAIADKAQFNKFAYDRAVNYYILNKPHEIIVSDKIRTTLHNQVLIDISPINASRIDATINLIVVLDLPLNDDELFSLLPYSYVPLKEKLDSRSLYASTYLDYLDLKFGTTRLINQISELIGSPCIHITIKDEVYRTWSQYLRNAKIQQSPRLIERILLEYLTNDNRKYARHMQLNIFADMWEWPDESSNFYNRHEKELDHDTRIYYCDKAVGNDDYKYYIDESHLISYIEALYCTKKDKKEEMLNILLRGGSKKGLRWTINRLKSYPYAFRDHFASLNYGKEDIDPILELIDVGLPNDKCREPTTVVSRVVTCLENIAMTDTESRDKVIEELHKLAYANSELAYLHRTAGNIDKKYYETTNKCINVKQSNQRYEQLIES